MSKLCRMLIMGPPGSGKGTISSRILRDFGFSYVPCGDLLRSHILRGTEEGVIAKDFIDKGKFVPDDIVTRLVFKELEKLASSNWLLDGFPRTIAQADALKGKVSLCSVIQLNVPDEVIIDRLKGRWTHIPSGRIYHTDFNPPKAPGLDDVTGEKLEQRHDDLPETVKTRLQNYRNETEPVKQYYSEKKLLHEFSGQSSNEIWVHVQHYIRTLMKMP